MTKNRVEAFSDGVIAIIITIMVLELKVPHDASTGALTSLLPVFGSYVMSFIYVGIYWNNHHHLFHATSSINGKTLWANLHLLFWLSLIPFSTAWMGENHFATLPVALYGAVLLMAGTAYYILARVLMSSHADNHKLKHALGKDKKGIASMLLYTVSIVLAFFHTASSVAIFIFVALMWLVPDKRIEFLERKS